MKAHAASLMNAICLIVVGIYAHYMSDLPYPMTLFPVIIGLILLTLNNGIKKENKIIKHGAILLTLLIAISLLFIPLKIIISSKDVPSMVRLGLMIYTSFLALYYLILSIRPARIN